MLKVFGNRVLMIVFGPNRDEVTGNWSRLGDKELNDLYSLSNINLVIRSRKMRGAVHVACMGGGAKGVQVGF